MRRLLYFSTLLLTLVRLSSAEAEKVKYSTACPGATVGLACSTTVSYYVDWRRLETLNSDHAYIYFSGHITAEFRSRFSLETSEASEDGDVNTYTLVIANVQLNDSVYYLCIEDGGFGNRHFFHLNVTETEDCISQKSAAVWSVIIVLVVLLVFVGVGAAIFVGYWRQLRRRRRQKTKTGDSEYAEIEEPLLPLGKPDPPVCVRVEGTSVTLDWKPPVNVGEHEIVGYVIKYSTVDTDPTQFGTVEFDSELIYTPHTFIGSLQPYTFYVFAVAAKYENGEGPLSHFSEPVQTKTAVPGSPAAPEVCHVLSTSCTVKYQLPADEGDTRVTGYQVEMKTGVEGQWTAVGDPVEGLELVVEGLTPCCQYQFRVAAVNCMGVGEFSSASELVTCLPEIEDESVSFSALQRSDSSIPPGKPGAPVLVSVKGTSVSLEWTSPDATGSHKILGYCIMYGTEGSSTENYDRQPVDQPTTSHTFAGKLKPKTAYRFAVAAHNKTGQGEWSKWSESIRTHAAVPGPPASLEVCNVLSTSCTVKYQPPADEGDAKVTDYQVQRRGVMGKDEHEWETVNETSGSSLELVVDHLKPLSRYQFRVAAVNNFGVGEFGPPSQYVTTDNSCVMCGNIPQDPKTLPCHHNFCQTCFDRKFKTTTEDRHRCTVDDCHQPFTCPRDPETGCKPLRTEEFTTDHFSDPLNIGIIRDCNYKVMGVTVLRNLLYSVHHNSPDVYIHSTKHPFDRHGHPNPKQIDNLRWPRGIAASQRHGFIFITDWYRNFRGRLWRATENITQSDARELEVQPFGVSVCEETDRVVVTCCTPTFLGVSTANQLFIYHAANFTRLQTVALSGAYNILRSAIVIGNNFAVCHGWFKPGKVVMVNQSGVLKDCEYGGSNGSGTDQSLNKPLDLHRLDDSHFLVVDYSQHRIHLLTSNLQFVRHLICRQGPDDADVTNPRKVCVDAAGQVYVGTESGTVSIYSVRHAAMTSQHDNGNDNDDGWLLVHGN